MGEKLLYNVSKFCHENLLCARKHVWNYSLRSLDSDYAECEMGVFCSFDLAVHFGLLVVSSVATYFACELINACILTIKEYLKYHENP